jgi:DNA replication and repair protein RecF
MTLKSLSLTNFRNYPSASFSFSPQTTLIVGPNTAGKTNILEAIHMLATGKSFRATYDREVIRGGESIAYLECLLNQQEQERFLSLAVVAGDQGTNTSSKRFKINGVKKTRSAFVGHLRAVIFSPEEIALITGSPSRRRRYIDSVLTQVDNEYTRTLAKYEKVLRQRNRLLKLIREGEATRDQLNLWDEKLLQLGPILTNKRQDFFRSINKHLVTNQLFLDYQPKILNPEVLSKYRDREIAAGKTFYGPHRDDFAFLQCDPLRRSQDRQTALRRERSEQAVELTTRDRQAAGRDLATYGSRGEQRLAVLHLKLAELELISERVGERPLLLLDDIFSELDSKNRHHVLSPINKQQTIITTTDLEHIDGDKLPEHQLINLPPKKVQRYVPLNS